MTGAQLSALSVLPPVAIISVICFMTAMLTEIMSNTATATILLPVINEMVRSTFHNLLVDVAAWRVTVKVHEVFHFFEDR